MTLAFAEFGSIQINYDIRVLLADHPSALLSLWLPANAQAVLSSGY